MGIADRSNRTWICTVVFTDIVGFSKVSSIQTQLAIKRVFNGYLTEALKPSVPDDLIILDTGDGAAICFSDPEDAVFSSLAMRNSFIADQSIPNFKLEVRIGINLGPVKLIKDLNGKMNAVGDGINDAQRVMSFADPNHILVSRSFYEVARSLADEYQNLFAYQGTRTDKHVREHSVYSLLTPGEVSQVKEVPKVVELAPPEWPPDLLKQVELKLARSVGPIARLLVKNAARGHAEWKGFLDSLLEHLPTEKERKEFTAYCEGLQR